MANAQRQEGSSRPIVWVVDDSRLDRDRAAHALRGHCEVETWSDGSVVLEQLASRPPPEVLVLDWMMPGVSGIEVIEYLRAQPGALAQIPVLLLTAHHEPDQIAAGLAAGANDYLSKPFNDQELIARVNALLRSAELLARANAAEKALRATIASAPDALFAVDTQGRVRFANQQAGQVFGRPPEALVGVRIVDLVPDLFRSNVAVGASDSLLPLPDVAIGERVFSPSFGVLPTDTAASTTVALRDVTERRRTEQRRLDFYSIVAHDLRSPLNAMTLRTQMMMRGRRGPIPPEILGDLQLFERNFRSMVAMINDFLELARLEGTGYRLNRDDIDVRGLISTCVDELRPLAEASGLSLDWDAPADAMPIAGDRHRLGQVLSNLVGNALKFTPSGGSIRVEVSAGAGVIETRVRDTGPGIAAGLKPDIFKRFTRAPEQQNTIGSGLGLMIVREIVEAHGGVVGVESAPGQGSTFWFRLPALQRRDAGWPVLAWFEGGERDGVAGH